jgi:DNA-binding response OmpR family regulator
MKRILVVDDAVLDLANKEFGIIELLSLNVGQVFSQDRIYENAVASILENRNVFKISGAALRGRPYDF